MLMQYASPFIWLLFPMFFMTVKFFSNHSHLMILLLVLELMMLLNMYILLQLICMSMIMSSFYLVFLVVSVGEACLGLSILVYMARNFGEDMGTPF